jgi:nucleotide-binding universal stress UspA family protein
VKDVLVHVTIRSDSTLEDGTLYALGLAASQGARVTAFLSEVEPRYIFTPPDNMQGGITRIGVEPSRAEEARRIASLVRATATDQRVGCEVLVSDLEGQAANAELAMHARVRDLLVVSVYGPVQYPRLALVETVLFGIGRPLMLVPWRAGPYRVRTAVIAWDATRAASRAFHDAMPLLTTATDVVVVTVLGDKDLEPGESGEEVCRALNHRNISARFEAIPDDAQDVGATLVQAATRLEADLLVMGGFAHPMERELLFGSATRSIFRSGCPCPSYSRTKETRKSTLPWNPHRATSHCFDKTQ